jgi:hypothetical protein
LYYRAIITKIAWYTKTDTESYGREDPKINPHSYSHMIFDNGAKNIHWRKDRLFNKWC